MSPISDTTATVPFRSHIVHLPICDTTVLSHSHIAYLPICDATPTVVLSCLHIAYLWHHDCTSHVCTSPTHLWHHTHCPLSFTHHPSMILPSPLSFICHPPACGTTLAIPSCSVGHSSMTLRPLSPFVRTSPTCPIHDTIIPSHSHATHSPIHDATPAVLSCLHIAHP